MIFAILKIPNNNISGTGRPINFVLDSRRLLSAASEPHLSPTCNNLSTS